MARKSTKNIRFSLTAPYFSIGAHSVCQICRIFGQQRHQAHTAFMNPLRNVIRFYVEGFREMTLGRTLWAILLVKLFVMFAVLKLFFFRDPLAGQSAAQRSTHVLEQLTDTTIQSL